MRATFLAVLLIGAACSSGPAPTPVVTPTGSALPTTPPSPADTPTSEPATATPTSAVTATPTPIATQSPTLGPNCDAPAAPGVNWSGCDLDSAYLYRADLTGADLSGANLSNADMSFAVLREASLREANLRSASLEFANLSGADLTGADLSNAYLGYASLYQENSGGATGTPKNHRQARYLYTTCPDATLRDTDCWASTNEPSATPPPGSVSLTLEGQALGSVNAEGPARCTLLDGGIVRVDAGMTSELPAFLTTDGVPATVQLGIGWRPNGTAYVTALAVSVGNAGAQPGKGWQIGPDTVVVARGATSQDGELEMSHLVPLGADLQPDPVERWSGTISWHCPPVPQPSATPTASLGSGG